MDEKSKRNVSGLLRHAAFMKSDTEEKVNSTIDALTRSKTQKINFKTVSELSGVSTTTLYNNSSLCERISSLRAVKNAQEQDMDAHETEKRDRNRELRQEIKKLKEEKQMLIEQLVEFERMKAENHRLKALLNHKKID